MAENSAIEWTDHTFNPWIGCTKVSDGCKHCYAETLMDHRYGKVQWGPQGERKRTSDANWRKPIQWNKHPWYECNACGWRGAVARSGPRWNPFREQWSYAVCERCRSGLLKPTRCRVFCGSLCDVFEDRRGIDALNYWRAQLWRVIEDTPNLDWLLLTKRPENVNNMIPAHWRNVNRWPDNVWIGTSVEDQATADKRIPELLEIPARTRFLSCEPLLGPLDLKLEGIHWVIAGGESGAEPAVVRSADHR
jgi:protein gp37